MPTRREFLSTATVTLLLIPLAHCGSSSSAGPQDGGGAGGPPGCTGVGSTSTSVADPLAGNALHTHTLCVLQSDLTSPPAAGVAYETSVALGHEHSVMLTQPMLQTIQSGGSVTVTTSTVGMHMHMFTIMKAAGQSGGASGGTAGTSTGY